MDEQLIQALTDLDEEGVLRRVRDRLDANDDPQAILAACREGLARVGQRFERGEYFVSELIMAGEVVKQVIAELGPLSTTGQGATRGAIVFGTVKSDIHDIGKDLVIGMLRAAGFDVTDLGIDVPPERFVAAVRETGAKVVGLSGLLTVACVLVLAVREIDCEWDVDDADAGAVALPARFEIRYRTHAIDLTQTG